MSRLSHWTASLLCLLAAGCQQPADMEHDSNAVYYWRTELRLDSTERDFLKRHSIEKVYCRYFDVVMKTPASTESSADGTGAEPMPNATLAFAGTLPAGIELIPTVYITEDCMHRHHEGLAANLVRRILQMNETNDMGSVSEIQIDCDYTARSRDTYYRFLEEVRQSIREQTDGRPFRLSTTIRLHQLSMLAPPVDYGVLMLYNTGDPRKFMERNPVLDIRDVLPYLPRLHDYPLPLAAAYPVYRWLRIVQGVHIEHTVAANEILRVKQAVERERPGLRRAVITYHLDKDNINRYNTRTYEKIYHH